MSESQTAIRRHLSDVTGGQPFPNVDIELAPQVIPTDDLAIEIRIPTAYPEKAPTIHVLTSQGGLQQRHKTVFVMSRSKEDDQKRALWISDCVLMAQSMFRPAQAEQLLGRCVYLSSVDPTPTIRSWVTGFVQTAPIFRPAALDKFRTLVSNWRATRNQFGSVLEMCSHPAYQRIIGMGQEAVPLILRELEQQVDHWFWALKAITGADPILEHHRGQLPLMAEDWLDWGKIQGYRW